MTDPPKNTFPILAPATRPILYSIYVMVFDPLFIHFCSFSPILLF